METPTDILMAIIRHRRGLGKYNFKSLSLDDRLIAQHDAWMEIESRIEAFIMDSEESTEQQTH
jgi:hypothetical protein